MPATEKFMFDRSFDLPDLPEEEEVIEESEPEEPEIIIPTFSEEEMKAARDEGFAQGREEGVHEASEATERLISETTKTIDAQLTQLFDQQRNANTKIFQESISVGVTVAKKCFPHMNAENGINEIEHIVGEILTQILEEPRVIINIHPDLRAPLSARMETVTENTHFDGRIVIREDAEVAPGNCRIEWSNGGAERNMDELWQQIDQIVESNLAGEQDATEFALSPDQSTTSPSDDSVPTQEEMDANTESPIENEADEEITPPAPPEEPASADLSQADSADGQDTLEGSPPSPDTSTDEEVEEEQNMQNTAPFEPSSQEDIARPPASDSEQSSLPQADADSDAPTPFDETEDASVEPDAEAGIVTVNPDADTSDTPEQPA